MTQLALITSTIAPAPGTFMLAQSDPVKRLHDYQQGLAFYCEHLRAGVFDLICYVDNSGHPLDSLRDIAQRKGVGARVEFVSYRSSVDPGNGRFYHELRLIEHFMQHSLLVREKPGAQIWKLSGRYRIANIGALVENVRHRLHPPGRLDLLANCRDLPLRWTDFYVAAFTRPGWDRLFASQIPLYAGRVDGERVLREQIDRSDWSGLRLVRRLPVVPRLEGTRGYDGARYDGMPERLKYLARRAMLRLAPALWI